MGNSRHLGLMCIMSTRQKKTSYKFHCPKAFVFVKCDIFSCRLGEWKSIVQSCLQCPKKFLFFVLPCDCYGVKAVILFTDNRKSHVCPTCFFPFPLFFPHSRICFPIRSTFVRSARDHLYYYFVTTGELTCEERK